MKVAFFRARQPKRQIFAESIRFTPVFFSIEKTSKIDETTHFLTTRNLIPCWTGFRPHFDPMLEPFWEAFGVSWGRLAPILAARGAPRPIPRGLLGSLGMLESLQATLMIDFGPA